MKQRKGFQRVAAMLMALIMIASTLLPSSGVQAAVTEKKIEISKIGLIRNNGDPYNNSSGDSWLRLHLSESDYASGGAVASGITNGDTSWFKTYGTLDKIKIYTNESEEPVALKDILDTTTGVDQNVYCPFFDSNTIAFNITNNYDGKTITKVVIEKGAAFPSQTDRSGTVYVTTKDMIATTKDTSQYQNDSGWNYTRVEDTTVTRFENFTSAEGDPGRLFFTLGTTDLTNSVSSQIFKNKELGTKYNMLDYILFYTTAGEYKKAREVMQNFDEFYWNLWTRWDSISFKTTLNPADVKFVLIKKGCEFPSYAEDQNYGKATLSTVYRTTTDIVFNMNDGASSTSETPITGVSGTEVPTELSGLEILHNTDEDYRLRVKLTTNDYTSAPASAELAANWQYRYNMLDMIDLYLDVNGQETLVSLRQAATGTDGHFNLWGSTGAFSLKMTGAYNGTTIRKVVFKKGCQLPSYGMEKGTGTNIYVLTEDEVFESTNLTNVANKTNWNKVDTSVPYDTSVTQIIGGHNGGTQLSFLLSANDYTVGTQAFSTASSKEMQYNFLDKIEVYTTSGNVKLGDASVYNGGANSFYKMHDKANNITIGLKVSASSISKIVIPAGTVFPSYAYSIGQNAKKYGYRTTETITFVNQNDTSQTNPWGEGTCWTVYEEPANIETTISKIQVRGEENQNGYLFVFLGNNDYAGVAPNTPAGNKIAEYEPFSKIELSTETETKPLSEVITTEKTYNRYGATGSISFGLKPGWNGTTIKRITFKQGTEFPSYSYTNGSATSKKAYVLPEDITYTTPASKWSNEEWYEYYEPVTYPTEITNIHVRDGFVLLFLSNHDYAKVAATTPIGSKWSVYNLLDNITITTKDATNKLSNILPEKDEDKQAFYNIFEEIGAVGIKMRDGYNGTTIKKVAIKKGAEFPAYDYTDGGAKAITSYVTEKDYVFNTGNTTATNNTEWTKVTPYSSETDVSGVTVVDGKLTFTLSKNDYTSGEVGSNHTDFDYWNNVKVYTNDTIPVPLSTWVSGTTATYGNDTLSVTGSGDVERVVIPAKTVFPSYKYTSGQIAECVGYYVPGEKVFEKQSDGTWKDVSRKVSKVSGDVNGDGIVSSKDIIAMAKYAKNGYGYNASSLTYDETKTAADNRNIVRRVILGDVLHNYEKESDSLTYFSSSDIGLDSFLNDFYKRQIGYNDYVEGDMTVNSYKPGTTYSSIYNLPWLTKSLLWVDSKNSLESDRTAQLKKQIESIIVDRYGYVWNGDDAVEEPTLGIGKKHGMGWPFPNASQAGGEGYATNVRHWEFNTGDTLSTWTSNCNATLKDGLYQGTASGTSATFTVKHNGLLSYPIIKETKSAPWLVFELRMSGVTNPDDIDDIYVTWKSCKSNSTIESATEYTVQAREIAALNYAFAKNYEHVLYLPMYTHEGWNGKYIREITIEVRAKDGKTLDGTFALNYVRPSFDTRHSNNNANYIEAIKEYYNMTGDVDFVKANITKARKAMNFYLQMYNTTEKLNDQSYLYGHGGSRKTLETGLGNGYWDILYTPKYDFQSNMYFYQALSDLSYLEGVLSKNSISVSDSATIDTATTAGIGTRSYGKSADELKTIANDVVSAMRDYFWNKETERFMAGYDNSSNKVDYGYTTWNLQAIELGIATKDQKASIMSWIDGSRTVTGDVAQTTDIYKYSFAPRTATVDDKRSSSNASGIYGAFIENGGNDIVKQQKFGDSLQFGGAVMYSSYYDLTSRIQVNGANDALKRLKGIQTWYDGVSDYFSKHNVANDEFYFQYFLSEDIKPQNGSKEGYGNGAVGIDGEFTESLLVASAIPYGFFGMDSEGGNTLCVSPSLPSTMDHWKVENMQYNGVTYDLSIYKDAVRIDSVRGDATGLSVKVTLDCPVGKDIYVGGKAQNVKAGGKATVKVDFKDAIIEVKVKEK